MKSKKITFQKSWRHWAEGYLNLAEQGLIYFKNKKNLGKRNLVWDKQGCIKSFGEDYYKKCNKKIFDLGDGSMFIAIIWNIKHGIELLIKALGVNIDKEYWHGHNLEGLKKELKKKIELLCVKEYFNFFEYIVDKYYNCDFSDKTKYFDSDNTLFKYPEIKDKQSNKIVSLDYSFVHNVSRKELNQFLNDVYNLKILGSILEASIQSFKSAKKLGIDKRKNEKQLMNVPTMKNPGLKNKIYDDNTR